MEVETKYVVPDAAVFARLASLDELAGLQLADFQTVSVHDRYVDSPDYAFLHAGYSCRVRSKGGVVLVTVKSCVPASGALHSREEYETVIEPGTGRNPDSWPAGLAAGIARRLSAGRPLELLVELFQERQKRAMILPETGDRVIELSLDKAAFSGSAEKFYELEAEERVAGQAALLARLDEVLTGEWGLAPQPLSKFERALQLARPDLYELLRRG
ncbi:MAG: CYTH domain-containing protein [Caldilineales bacterium]